VIAAGFVFALNQGNEATVSNASTRVAGAAAELERLNDLALQVRAQHPAFNIEKTKMELAGQLVEHPAFNIEKTKMELAGQLVEHPGVSPEKTRMDYQIDKLDEVMPSFERPAELVQPEWDNRMP
jgi:hypothetical protein